MQAIILAGGLGTRLRERVADVPKAMAPVAGRPFLDYLLEGLERAGFEQAVLATGHLAHVIRAHVADRFGRMAVAYSHEAQPLGTGGAVLQALRQHAGGRPALVLNGDTWLGLDLRAFVAWCDADPRADAMVLREVADASRYGQVVLEGGRVVRFGEKRAAGPGLINAGVYWVREASFDGWALPPVFSLEKDYFEPRAAQLNLRGYVCDGTFIDIGVPSEFDRAQTLLPLWQAGERAAG